MSGALALALSWSRCVRLCHDRNPQLVALRVGHGQRKVARLRGGVPELEVHPAGVPEDDQRAQGEVGVVGDVEHREWLLLTEKAGVAPHLESGGVTARSRCRPPVWMGYALTQHVVVCDDGKLDWQAVLPGLLLLGPLLSSSWGETGMAACHRMPRGVMPRNRNTPVPWEGRGLTQVELGVLAPPVYRGGRGSAWLACLRVPRVGWVTPWELAG